MQCSAQLSQRTARSSDNTLLISGGQRCGCARHVPTRRSRRQGYADSRDTVRAINLASFHAEETLISILIEKSVPVNALTAYAGWNTASNAIGTALANVLLSCAMQRQLKTQRRAHVPHLCNLAFLQDASQRTNFI